MKIMPITEMSKKYQPILSKMIDDFNQHNSDVSVPESFDNYYLFAENDTIPGYTKLSKIDKKSYFVDHIYIDKPYRNKGYGKALCNHVQDYLKNQNIKNIFIQYAYDNETAKHIYKLSGFTPIVQLLGKEFVSHSDSKLTVVTAKDYNSYMIQIKKLVDENKVKGAYNTYKTILHRSLNYRFTNEYLALVKDDIVVGTLSYHKKETSVNYYNPIAISLRYLEELLYSATNSSLFPDCKDYMIITFPDKEKEYNVIKKFGNVWTEQAHLTL